MRLAPESDLVRTASQHSLFYLLFFVTYLLFVWPRCLRPLDQERLAELDGSATCLKMGIDRATGTGMLTKLNATNATNATTAIECS